MEEILLSTMSRFQQQRPKKRTMKETSTEQIESAQVSHSPDQLSSPHFDESAVAAAQPVEPLKRGNAQTRFFYWPRRWPVIISVVALTVLAPLAVAVLVVRHQTEAVITSTIAEPQPASQPIQVATPGSLTTAKVKVANGNAKVERSRPKPRIYERVVVADEGKPVARKVGVLYGRTANRP